MSEDKVYFDCLCGDFTTYELSMKAGMERRVWERAKKEEWEAAPKPGYGLDGYPLQECRVESEE